MSSILTFSNRSVKLFTFEKSFSDNSESSAFCKNVFNRESCLAGGCGSCFKMEE